MDSRTVERRRIVGPDRNGLTSAEEQAKEPNLDALFQANPNTANNQIKTYMLDLGSSDTAGLTHVAKCDALRGLHTVARRFSRVRPPD